MRSGGGFVEMLEWWMGCWWWGGGGESRRGGEESRRGGRGKERKGKGKGERKGKLSEKFDAAETNDEKKSYSKRYSR